MIEHYKNLKIELEVYEMMRKEYEREIQILKRSQAPSGYKEINYDGMPKGNMTRLPFDRVVERIELLERKIEAVVEVTKGRKEVMERIKAKLEELEGIDKQVVYMRDVEGMKLQDIADELGYSHQYIKEISARLKPTKSILTY